MFQVAAPASSRCCNTEARCNRAARRIVRRRNVRGRAQRNDWRSTGQPSHSERLPGPSLSARYRVSRGQRPIRRQRNLGVDRETRDVIARRLIWDRTGASGKVSVVSRSRGQSCRRLGQMSEFHTGCRVDASYISQANVIGITAPPEVRRDRRRATRGSGPGYIRAKR